MKKTIFVLLALFVAIVFAGCGDKVEGKWQLESIDIGGGSYTLEEHADEINAKHMDNTELILEIDSERTFKLFGADSDEAVAEGHYETIGEDDKTYEFYIDGNTVAVRGTLEDGKLVLHDTSSSVESKMYFVK